MNVIGFDKTITVFNKFIDESGERPKTVWQKTVLNNCYFAAKAYRNAAGGAVSSVYTHVCKIPENAKYLPPVRFKATPEGHFTLAPGDLIFGEEISESITGVSPFTENEVRKLHEDRCLIISTIADRTGTRLPHYRVE